MMSCLPRTRSRIKWRSSLMCLVLAWNIGLATKWVALLLSHQSRGGEEEEKQISCKIDWIQIIFEAVDTRADTWILHYCETQLFVCWRTMTLNSDQGICHSHWCCFCHLDKMPNRHKYINEYPTRWIVASECHRIKYPWDIAKFVLQQTSE